LLTRLDNPTASCRSFADAYETDSFKTEGNHCVTIIPTAALTPRTTSPPFPTVRISTPNHKMNWDACSPTGHIVIFLGPPPIGRKSRASAIALGATMLNGTIATTLTDSNTSLTIAIKTLAGNDPSSNDPVGFIFPRNSVTLGNYSISEVVSALNVKIPAGSTLGTASNTPFRIWLFAFLNGPSLQLGVINCLSAPASSGASCSVYPLANQRTLSVRRLR
jgi:hypothetical protein